MRQLIRVALKSSALTRLKPTSTNSMTYFLTNISRMECQYKYKKATLKILDFVSSDAMKNIHSSFQKGLYAGTISIIIHYINVNIKPGDQNILLTHNN